MARSATPSTLAPSWVQMGPLFRQWLLLELGWYSFWTSSDQVPIYNNEAGDAVIDLTEMNNQTITIEGVSADQITDNNIVF